MWSSRRNGGGHRHASTPPGDNNNDNDDSDSGRCRCSARLSEVNDVDSSVSFSRITDRQVLDILRLGLVSGGCGGFASAARQSLPSTAHKLTLAKAAFSFPFAA